ncbi:MAG: uridine kinase family protein [Omnitrophica WOR_2 bacterium]
MTFLSSLFEPEAFSEILYHKMQSINPGVQDLELYEFRYCLDNMVPQDGGWASVRLDPAAVVEKLVHEREFYEAIQLKPRIEGRIVLDESIVRLTNMLFVGLVDGAYTNEWIRQHFYFDLRGFFFLVRTVYYSLDAVKHFNGAPYRRFEQKQKCFERCQGISYKEFKAANLELDQSFIEIVQQIVATRGAPFLLTLAGPTASGKTEIVERLRSAFEQSGKQVTTIEMDNFLLDNDYRDEMGIKTLGKEAYHYDLFMKSLDRLIHQQPAAIPQYSNSGSSHARNGSLKPGFTLLEVEPSDIIFLEGNFPFQIPEVSGLIGLKIVYLTDDPIRLKRKWKRDMDYRKKYDLNYFRNRFFRTQFLRAQDCYQTQIQVCDILVDTTGAMIWITPETAKLLRPV